LEKGEKGVRANEGTKFNAMLGTASQELIGQASESRSRVN